MCRDHWLVGCQDFFFFFGGGFGNILAAFLIVVLIPSDYIKLLIISLVRFRIGV